MTYVLFVCTQNAGRPQIGRAFYEPTRSASTRRQHRMRISQLVSGLVEEFGDRLEDEEIRTIADRSSTGTRKFRSAPL